VIVFRLDSRSKVATYMQLVQQVRQSLRTGLIESGDQLPKVRDVAESLAINPNTVLKAYRELELEGLVEGRPGVGTFVVRSLAAWLRRARVAGLEQEDVVALVETTMRESFEDVSHEGAA
jgi:GntR family transcriptional regulator